MNDPTAASAPAESLPPELQVAFAAAAPRLHLVQQEPSA